MRVLAVHNRYRSDAPSGENRVVDEESALLREGGHEVELFQVTSDAIAGFGPLRRALLPASSCGHRVRAASWPGPSPASTPTSSTSTTRSRC